jgi:hypothetical protein
MNLKLQSNTLKAFQALGGVDNRWHVCHEQKRTQVAYTVHAGKHASTCTSALTHEGGYDRPSAEEGTPTDS